MKGEERCIARLRDQRECKRPAKQYREPYWLCGVHAELFDEYVIDNTHSVDKRISEGKRVIV